MKIDFKVVCLILAVCCQFYYVEGWWGGGSRSSFGSRSRIPVVRTSSRRGGWWSRRTPGVSGSTGRRGGWLSRRLPSRVRTPRVWTPRIRTPSVSRRGGWLSRRLTSRVRTPRVWTPRIRKPSVSRRGGWFSRSRTPRVRTPSIRKPSVSRRGGWWSKRRKPSVTTPRVRRPSIRKPSVSKPSVRKPSVRKTKSRKSGYWLGRRTPGVKTPSVKNQGQDSLKVSKGQITFDAEGNDKVGNKYFSRRPHIPSSSSGITLGRGYDLKEKTESQVYNDLVQSGIPKATAKTFSKGVGLSGQAAKNYIKKNNLQSFTVTHGQQKQLFTKTYNSIAADAKRIATKSDVVKKYGKTNWAQLNGAIKDVVVDLRYRGDYTPTTRRKIQNAIAANNLKKFKELMSDRDYWVKTRGVPKDRFERREKALEEAVKKG